MSFISYNQITYTPILLGTLAPSGDTSGNTDTGALNALLNIGPGLIQLEAGIFYITSVEAKMPPQWIVGAGRGVTVINAVGGGVGVIRMYNPAYPTDGWDSINVFGGGVLGLTIDGSMHTGTGAYGIHIGDGEEYQIDVRIQNFAAANDIGLWMQNTIFWTEKCNIKAALSNNTTACTLSVTTISGNTASDSFEYNDLQLDIYAAPGQNGLYLNYGAYIDNGSIRIRGNMNNSATSITVGACLTVTGQDPKTSAYSLIQRTFFDIAIESDQTGSYFPQTINFGSTAPATNQILSCNGILAFSGAVWTPSNVTGNAQNVFGFAGVVYGDTTLCSGSSPSDAGGPGLLNVGSPIIYAQNLLAPGPTPAAGTIYDASGDFFTFTLAANTTIQLGNLASQQPGGSIQGPQRKLLVIKQPSSGTTYTVAWPVNSSPSNLSPTVVWLQGGTAPPVSMANSAVTVFELITFDGATWYGNLVTPGSNATFNPADAGLVAANYDPKVTTGAHSLTTSTIYLERVEIRQATLWKNVCFVVTTAAGSGGTPAAYVGLYQYDPTSDDAGLLSGSSNCATNFQTPDAPGGQTVSLTTPVSLSAVTYSASTYVWVAILTTGFTSAPALAGTGSSQAGNAFLTYNNYASCTWNTTMTSLPGSLNSVVGGMNTAIADIFWVGGS